MKLRCICPQRLLIKLLVKLVSETNKEALPRELVSFIAVNFSVTFTAPRTVTA